MIMKKLVKETFDFQVYINLNRKYSQNCLIAVDEIKKYCEQAGADAREILDKYNEMDEDDEEFGEQYHWAQTTVNMATDILNILPQRGY
jgi:hypothetical protein